MFATYSIHTAASELGVVPKFIKSASSAAIFAWAHRSGFLLEHPEDGCVALVRGGPTGHQHTLLVHTVKGDDLVTIEGNLSNRVRWNHRAATSGLDFVRIA